jgi:hypothetical protein
MKRREFGCRAVLSFPGDYKLDKAELTTEMVGWLDYC